MEVPPRPSVLLCAPSGTNLSTIAARLAEALPKAVVFDLEHELCLSYKSDPRLAVEPGDLPSMESVVRQPRLELLARWQQACKAAVRAFRGRSDGAAAVLTLHLSWYNSNTNEFFSPVDSSLLASMSPSFDRVVILIDDIYDMYQRLQGKFDLYDPAVQANAAALLAKLGVKKEKLDAEERHLLAAQLELEAVERACHHLLAWRRSEIIHAENLAHVLDADLTVLGTKHRFSALRDLVTSTDTPEVYLSHRITEVRRMNQFTNDLPYNLGTWSPVADEVNRLHSLFADQHQVLINPTAIDELRFGSPISRTERSRYLAARWPLPPNQNELLCERSPGGHEHTLLFDHSDLGPDEPLPGSIVRSLGNRVFFEIAFRDHVIVEHTPGLLVYRPFFHRRDEDSKPDWSGGVTPEIIHWQDKTLAPEDHRPLRRAAFVHTSDEITDRLWWLNQGANLADHFTIPFKSHLRPILQHNKFPFDLINAIVEGRADGKERFTHLAMNPINFLERRWKGFLQWVATSALIALHSAFTQLERPNQHGDHAQKFDVALVTGTVSEDRSFVDLEGAAQSLVDFFAGSVLGVELSRPFWVEHDRQFRQIFGKAPDDLALEILGLPKDFVELREGRPH